MWTVLKGNAPDTATPTTTLEFDFWWPDENAAAVRQGRSASLLVPLHYLTPKPRLTLASCGVALPRPHMQNMAARTIQRAFRLRRDPKSCGMPPRPVEEKRAGGAAAAPNFAGFNKKSRSAAPSKMNAPKKGGADKKGK